MGMGGPVVTLGISGPDGAGKSTVAGALAEALRRRGRTALVVHLYGCVLCRRAAQRPPRPERRASAPRLTLLLASLHALLDAAELGLRLALARIALRRRARSRRDSAPAVLLTDRSPLDGLAKHDPAPQGAVAAAWVALAHRYTRIVALDAPAATLAARDGQHAPAEMAAWRRRFATWSDRLGGLVLRPAPAALDATVAGVLAVVP